MDKKEDKFRATAYGLGRATSRSRGRPGKDTAIVLDNAILL